MHDFDLYVSCIYMLGAQIDKEHKENYVIRRSLFSAARIVPRCHDYKNRPQLCTCRSVLPLLLIAIRKITQIARNSIMPLPPKSPGLNPVENLWLFMRENWLSNRIFKSYDDIVAHCCDAWRRLESQPWRIMSIGRNNGPMGSDQRESVLRRASTIYLCPAVRKLDQCIHESLAPI